MSAFQFQFHGSSLVGIHKKKFKPHTRVTSHGRSLAASSARRPARLSVHGDSRATTTTTSAYTQTVGNSDEIRARELSRTPSRTPPVRPRWSATLRPPRRPLRTRPRVRAARYLTKRPRKNMSMATLTMFQRMPANRMALRQQATCEWQLSQQRICCVA